MNLRDQFHNARWRWQSLGAIQRLVIANAILFVIQKALGPGLLAWFGLVPRLLWSRLAVWQPITYLFLHGDLLHLLFNMYALWIFGTQLEQLWGASKVIKYFFITGIGAGIVHTLVTPFSMVPTIGASGAVMGILTAVAILFPNMEITLLLFFVFPVRIKARNLALVLGVFSLFSGIQGSPDGIAHFAHLGGMVVGWFYLKRPAWIRFGTAGSFRESPRRGTEDVHRWRRIADTVLDKANRVGMDRLNWRERRLLKKASRRMRGYDDRGES